MIRVARWVIVLGAVGWACYAFGEATWTYFATQEIVDSVLREAARRYHDSLSTGSQPDALAGYVRSSIVATARRDGFALQDTDVQASVGSGGISASVHWGHPLIRYNGADLLVVPMSIERSFSAPP